MDNYSEVFIEIEKLLKTKSNLIISIDGRAASGKSSLAFLISNTFGGNVFHMDDFYIPFDKRREDFKEILGGNIDLDRFTKEILGKINVEGNFSYKKFSCQKETFEEVDITSSSINIIEGAYSNLLEAEFDLKIFLNVNSEIQLERIKLRNGENAIENFKNIWIPLEERYIKETDLINNCDLLVDTSNFW